MVGELTAHLALGRLFHPLQVLVWISKLQWEKVADVAMDMEICAAGSFTLEQHDFPNSA